MNFFEIDRLFTEIAETSEEQKLRNLEEQIWQLWLEHPNPQLQKWTQEGIDLLQKNEVNTAIHLFTKIINEDPHYAEGWNKRAVAYYIRGSYKKSIDDIQKVLRIEARHFGALGGLYSICMTIGDLQRAKQALMALEKVYPQRSDLKKHIGQLVMQISSRHN